MSAGAGSIRLDAPPAPTVLVVVSDLLFRSRIDDAARRQGLALRVARSTEQLERHLARGLPALAIVDLEIDTMDAAAAIRQLRAAAGGAALSIVAYAGHTNVGAIDAGRAAGAEVVLARSGFVAQLPALLERAAASWHARRAAPDPAPPEGA